MGGIVYKGEILYKEVECGGRVGLYGRKGHAKAGRGGDVVEEVNERAWKHGFVKRF